MNDPRKFKAPYNPKERIWQQAETEGVRPDTQEGDPCNKCSTPVIKRSGKRKPGRDYYYEFHLICPNRQTTHHVESVKRFVEQPPSLL